MHATINYDGCLVIVADNSLEAWALREWIEQYQFSTQKIVVSVVGRKRLVWPRDKTVDDIKEGAWTYARED